MSIGLVFLPLCVEADSILVWKDSHELVSSDVLGIGYVDDGIIQGSPIEIGKTIKADRIPEFSPAATISERLLRAIAS